MTESLPANVAALQELVRSQQLEIERLKKRSGALSVRGSLEDVRSVSLFICSSADPITPTHFSRIPKY
jgi:hypothetical protein